MITINLASPEDVSNLVNTLSALSNLFVTPQGAIVPAPTAPVKKEKATVKEIAAPIAPVPEATVKSVAENSASEPVTVSLEDVREAVQTQAKAGKREAIKATLSSFGVANVTNLTADKYSEFLTAIKAL